jgi:hypothetical protein
MSGNTSTIKIVTPGTPPVSNQCFHNVSILNVEKLAYHRMVYLKYFRIIIAMPKINL